MLSLHHLSFIAIGFIGSLIFIAAAVWHWIDTILNWSLKRVTG